MALTQKILDAAGGSGRSSEGVGGCAYASVPFSSPQAYGGTSVPYGSHDCVDLDDDDDSESESGSEVGDAMPSEFAVGKAAEVDGGPKVVWYSVRDGDEDYYWNPATGETQWDKPKRATILAAADGGGEGGDSGGMRRASAAGATAAGTPGAPPRAYLHTHRPRSLEFVLLNE